MFRARQTRQPFRVRKLRCQIGGFMEFQIGADRLVGRDFHRAGTFQIVAHRANAKGVLAWGHLRRRESKAAFFIADNGDCYRGTRFAGADQHPFHLAFLNRGDLAGESDGRGSLRAKAPQHHRNQEKACFHHADHSNLAESPIQSQADSDLWWGGPPGPQPTPGSAGRRLRIPQCLATTQV